MKVNLKDVAELQSGVYLKANNKAEKPAYLLGIKDFDENLNLIEPSVVVEKSEERDKQIVEVHHILVVSTLAFNAYKLHESKDVYVASNSFILIKPDITKVFPNYLRWFLNHSNTQQQLNLLAQGSSRMPYVSQKKLESLLIDLPELAVQKDIAALYDLLNKEKILRQKLIIKREEYLQTRLFLMMNDE